MCDPPEDCLLEFSKFGAVYPSVFWPVVDCEDEKIDLAKLQSMIAPPIERVYKQSYEEGEPFMEYRIVVEEHGGQNRGQSQRGENASPVNAGTAR